DLGARIVDAVADHRPAVVLAGLRDVDLVAATWAVLVRPQLPGLRMDRGALRIAVAVAPDFRLGARAVDERIARRHRAVRPQPHDLAQMVAEVLRLIAGGEVLPHGEEQVAVGALRDAAAEVVAARERALLVEDDLDVAELGARLVDELRARHCGAA